MMKVLFKSLLMTMLVGAVSCTSLSEGGSQEPLPNPDHNRRVQQSTGNLEQVRKEMNTQSSVTNRKLNIEESHSHGPATTPTMERPQQVEGAPIDSTSHRPSWPVRPRVIPGE